MKKFIAYLVSTTLFVGTCTVGVYASPGASASNLAQKKTMVYLRPDVTVELNYKKQVFRDANGQSAYPINYNGTTYLPVRAISALMDEPVEWDDSSKTIYIGKTLSNPGKAKDPIPNGYEVKIPTGGPDSEPDKAASMVGAYLKQDITIMYDFEIQTFKDINDKVVYPINYNGSTYLPIRSVSQLMGEPVEWDGATKTVAIGDGENPAKDVEKETAQSKRMIKLRDIFDREEVLYFEATAKISKIKGAATLEEKQVISDTINENYLRAQSITLEIKGLKKSAFTKEEFVVYEDILAFAESTEYYILVLQNIACLAAQDSDYSMLAETFLYFAMDSQSKMEQVRSVIN